MKKIFLFGILTCLGVIGLAACGGSDSSNANSNTNRSTTSMVNSVMNTTGSAVNTVANTVSSATTSGPSGFITDAAQGGVAEVAMGQVALKNSQNAEVKKFAQMMITDHTKVNTELKALAAKKNVTVTDDIGKHKATMDKLTGQTGPGFDRTYVDAMVNDHEADVAEFQKQADNATDPDVKAFAAKTLPTLKKHLEAIKAIQSKMK